MDDYWDEQYEIQHQREIDAYDNITKLAWELAPWMADVWGQGDGYGGAAVNAIYDVLAEYGLHGPDWSPAMVVRARNRNLRVLERDKWECVYCGQPLGWGHPSVENPQIDHVVPRARGGGNGIDNLVAACRACNSAKGTMSAEEFRASREPR